MINDIPNIREDGGQENFAEWGQAKIIIFITDEIKLESATGSWTRAVGPLARWRQRRVRVFYHIATCSLRRP